MQPPLKLLQLNIEGSKHLDRIIPFLKQERPDVACLQELNEPDIKAFEEASGLRCAFVPMHVNVAGVRHGFGIFTRGAPEGFFEQQYGGSASATLPAGAPSGRKEMHDTRWYKLASVDLKWGEEVFRIATTHLPATDRGEATDFQREDAQRLLHILGERGEFVLTGDFNAPRGRKIASLFISKYKDNIPPEITTSIDGAIHRAGQLPYMVDYIFSTPGYAVSNVRGHTGLSDHWGFTADISKLV